MITEYNAVTPKTEENQTQTNNIEKLETNNGNPRRDSEILKQNTRNLRQHLEISKKIMVHLTMRKTKPCNKIQKTCISKY